MNKTFAEYTTSVAFSLQLSKRQCNTLLRLEECFDSEAKRWRNSQVSYYVVQVDSLKPLEARGLVYWNRDEQGHANGFAGLTQAGQLALCLIKEAGLTIENTNTAGVLGRVARMEAA